tara:strand:- start:59 stop:1126 length:1068 start_codon:yes stop_codon:yes gene_type:complete
MYRERYGGGSRSHTRTTKRAGAPAELQYAELAKGPAVVGSPRVDPSLFVCAMHLKSSALRSDADTIRLVSTLSHTNIKTVFSIAHDREPGVGYAHGDFSSEIPYVASLKPRVLALDYNWCQMNYIRSKDRYNVNWFTGKVQSAMERSGAAVFLLPNFIVYNEPKYDYMWQLFSGTGQRILELDRPVESFANYNRRKGVFKLKYFMISRAEAEKMHPLVYGTIQADKQLRRTGNEGRTWEVHQRYVHPDKAFFVFFPADKEEAHVRAYLQQLCGTRGRTYRSAVDLTYDKRRIIELLNQGYGIVLNQQDRTLFSINGEQFPRTVRTTDDLLNFAYNNIAYQPRSGGRVTGNNRGRY